MNMPAGVSLSEAAKILRNTKERQITNFEAEADRLALAKEAERAVEKEEKAISEGRLIDSMPKKRGRPKKGSDEVVKDALDSGYKDLSPRIYVSFINEIGTIKVPAIDAREGDYTLFIRLPYGAMQFIPNIGTQFTVEYTNNENDIKSVDVYFPGTSMEYPDLNCMFLVMVKVPKE